MYGQNKFKDQDLDIYEPQGVEFMINEKYLYNNIGWSFEQLIKEISCITSFHICSIVAGYFHHLQ